MALDCGWEEVQGFRSLDEYKTTLARLTEQVRSGHAARVDLDPTKRWGTAFDEQWFQCRLGGPIWRLVAPDPPFPGIFKPIN